MAEKALPVCKASELKPGERRIVEFAGRSIGLFNVNGSFHALRNRCPHQFAPLCAGPITGTSEPGAPGEIRWTRQGEVIRCPWHGWEFDILSGKSLFNPHRYRVKSYPVTVEAGSDEPAGAPSEDEDVDPAIETYPVTVEDGVVTVHV